MRKVMPAGRRGFTLLEIVVSVGVLAIVGVFLTQVFITALKTNSRGEVTREVKQNGDYAVNIMTRMIQNARDIASTCTEAGSADSSVTITNPDLGSTTFECKSDSGVLRISSTSAAPAYLTSSTITLVGADCTSAITFTCTQFPDGRKSVNFSFSLATKGYNPDKSSQAVEKFSTTADLRNQ